MSESTELDENGNLRSGGLACECEECGHVTGMPALAKIFRESLDENKKLTTELERVRRSMSRLHCIECGDGAYQALSEDSVCGHFNKTDGTDLWKF